MGLSSQIPPSLSLFRSRFLRSGRTSVTQTPVTVFKWLQAEAGYPNRFRPKNRACVRVSETEKNRRAEAAACWWFCDRLTTRALGREWKGLLRCWRVLSHPYTRTGEAVRGRLSVTSTPIWAGVLQELQHPYTRALRFAGLTFTGAHKAQRQALRGRGAVGR